MSVWSLHPKSYTTFVNMTGHSTRTKTQALLLFFVYQKKKKPKDLLHKAVDSKATSDTHYVYLVQVGYISRRIRIS